MKKVIVYKAKQNPESVKYFQMKREFPLKCSAPIVVLNTLELEE